MPPIMHAEYMSICSIMREREKGLLVTSYKNGQYSQSEQLHIARATHDDFEAVAMLYAALHGYNASLNEQFDLADNWRLLLHEHFIRTYMTERTLWMLAWDQQQPRGLLLLESHLDSPLFRHRTWIELVALYVDPAARGTGLAQRFMEEAKYWVEQHSMAQMRLYVTTQNERARSFYRGCGWQPIQEIWSLTLAPDSSLHAEEKGVSAPF
jgi:GNAT superfamily N-acetyltransferase